MSNNLTPPTTHLRENPLGFCHQGGTFNLNYIEKINVSQLS